MPNRIADPVSRRSFLQLVAAASAGAALPIVGEAQLARAQSPRKRRALDPPPAGSVIINANENPLGPCDGAREAIARITSEGGRYHDELPLELVETFAEQENLDPKYVDCYAGSSCPLHYTVLAFTSPERGFVTADPGYEAGTFAAKLSGAKVYPVPLEKSTYAHDVKAMVAADPNAGVLYICNPNNPTGTLTSREAIEYALEHKPKGALILIDEAYIHFSPNAKPSLDLVSAGKDVVVLRTFSKLYGMAGLRCGFAIARPDLLAKLSAYNGWNAQPITAVSAAMASLKHPDLVGKRRKINADARDTTFAFLRENGYSFIPSESNCFMVDTKRDGAAARKAMEASGVYVGRVWPVWPTYVRVTVGTPEEMRKFCAAYKQMMDQPVAAMELPIGPRPRHLPVESRSNILA